jgi:hypothetical protein
VLTTADDPLLLTSDEVAELSDEALAPGAGVLLLAGRSEEALTDRVGGVDIPEAIKINISINPPIVTRLAMTPMRRSEGVCECFCCSGADMGLDAYTCSIYLAAKTP